MSDTPREGWRQPPLFSVPHQPRVEHRTIAVEALVHEIRAGTISSPTFGAGSRRWRNRQSSAFIETLLLGLPVPSLYLLRDESGLTIIDGLQRVRAIVDFVDHGLRLSELRELSEFEAKRLRDLPALERRRLLETHLPMILLSGPDEQYLATEMFRRLNESNTALADSDLRALALDGKFYRFAKQCADMPLFRELVDRKRSTPDDAERLEIVLRFFAFSDRYEQFSHHIGAFLDEFISSMNREGFPHDRMLREFKETMTYVKTWFPYGFRKSSADDRVPRVRFEAIAIGVNLAMREGIISGPDLSWLESSEFQAVTRTEASNSRVRLAARVEFVRDRLLLRR